MLVERWEEVAGEEIAPLCYPSRLRKQKNAIALEVVAYHSAFATKIYYHQEPLLMRLRTELGYSKLTRLQIKHGTARETRQWASERLTAERLGKTATGSIQEQEPAANLSVALERMRQAMNAAKD